jgi:hypothetical protein
MLNGREREAKTQVPNSTAEHGYPPNIERYSRHFRASQDDGEIATPVPRECCGGFCETPILARSRFFGAELSFEASGLTGTDSHTYI